MFNVYLGIFEKIFNAILAPIIKFIGNLLGIVLGWVFNQILAPLLVIVFQTILPWLIELLLELFSGIFYTLLSWFLAIIDVAMVAFDILIGVKPVEMVINGKTQTFPLIEVFFREPTLRKVMWYLTAMGIALAAVFSIFAVVRSTFDFELEGRRPLSKVLSSMFRSFMSFAMVPIMCFVLIELAGALTKVVQAAFKDDGVSLGTRVMTICAYNAVNPEFVDNEKYAKMAGGSLYDQDGNLYAYQEEYDQNLEKGPLKMLLDASSATHPLDDKGNKIPNSEVKNNYFLKYQNVDAMTGKAVRKIEGPFDITKIDYLMGFLLGGFIAVMLCIVLFTFTSRFFEIATLYFASPIFVAYIPIDDGEKFQEWRKKFIARVFEGFGAVMSMRLFLFLVPIIMSNNLTLPLDGVDVFGMKPEYITYLVKMLFICGGIWAVKNVSATLTYLFDWDTAQHEANYIASKAMTATSKLGASGMQVIGKLKGAIESGAEKSKMKNEAQRKEFQERALASGAKNIKAPGERTAGGGVAKGEQGAGGKTNGEKSKRDQSVDAIRAQRYGRPGEARKDPILGGLLGSRTYRTDGQPGTGGYTAPFGLFSVKRGDDGKMHFNGTKNPFVSVQKQPDRIDENGNRIEGKYRVTSVLGGMLYNTKTGEDGRINSRSAAFGIWNQDIGRDESGKINYTDSSVLGGLVYKGSTVTDADGEAYRKVSVAAGLSNVVARGNMHDSGPLKPTGAGPLGITWEKLDDGHTHVTSALGYQRAFADRGEKDEDGNTKYSLIATELPGGSVYNTKAYYKPYDPEQPNPQNDNQQQQQNGGNNQEGQNQQQFNQHQPGQPQNNNNNNQPQQNQRPEQNPQQQNGNGNNQGNN